MSRTSERIKAILGNQRRRVLIAVGLVLFGMMTWDDGPGENLLGVAVLLACLAVAADEIDPSWWKKAPQWIRRPLLGSVAAAVFVVSYLLNAGFSFGALLFLVGTIVFLYDARVRDELAPFDPGTFTQGKARVVLLIGTLLACFSLSGAWLGDFSYFYSYDSGGYTYSGTSSTPSYDAHEVDDADIPVLLLLALVGTVAYAGRRPRWWTLLPAAIGAGMFLYGVVKIVENSRHVEEISGGGVSVPAGGPWLFSLGAALVLVGAVLSAKRQKAPDPSAPAAQAG